MKNVIGKYFTNNIDTLNKILAITALFAVLIVRLIKLDRGLIFSDEGWYLYLLRDLPANGSTRFHFIFHNVFNNNIYAIYVANYLFMLFSSCVFAWGLNIYCKTILNKHFDYLFILGVLFLGQLYIIDTPSFNYITLNVSVTQISLGFLLAALPNNKWHYFFLSGFFITTLFVIQATNIVAIPLFIISIWLLSQKNKLKNNVVFIFGALAFIICYLSFAEPPSQLVAAYYSTSRSTLRTSSSDYTWFFLVKWFFNTILYLIKCFVIVFVIDLVDKKIKTLSISRTLYLILISLTTVIAFLYFEYALQPGRTKEVYVELIEYLNLALVFYFFINKHISTDKNTLVVVLLLFFQLVCLSLGSNRPFLIRSSKLYVFITPILFLFSNNTRNTSKLLFVVYIFLLISYMIGINRKNWVGIRTFDNKVELSACGINQNIKITEKQASQIMFAKQYLEKGDCCLVDYNYWGLVALLDLKTNNHFWLPNVDTLNEEIKQMIKVNGKVYVIYNNQDEKSYPKIDKLLDNPLFKVEVTRLDDLSILCFYEY